MARSEAGGTNRTQAKQAWVSLLDTRMPLKDPVSSSDAQELDNELAVLDEVVVLARRRRNARIAWPCKLPAEVLGIILLDVKSGWGPKMTRMSERELEEDYNFRQEYPSKWSYHQTLKKGHNVRGWLNTTHVCSSLREVALALPSLWCDIECSELPSNYRDFIEARSAGQPLHYILDYNDDILQNSIHYTQEWLTPSACNHLHRLKLHRIDENYLRKITRSIPSLPQLSEFSLSLSTDEDVPAKLVDIKLPIASPHQLSRLSFGNCIPPLSSPMFSPGITHLSFSWTSSSGASIPAIDDILDMLCSLPRLEQLRLSRVPAGGGTAISDAPASPPRRRSLPPTFRRLECLMEKNGYRVHSALDVLSRLEFARGVEVDLNDHNRADVRWFPDDDITNLARLAHAAYGANRDLQQSPWGLLLTFGKACMLLGDDISWSTERLRSPDDMYHLYKERTTNSLTSIARIPDKADLRPGDLIGLCELLPLKSLASLSLDGDALYRLFNDSITEFAHVVEKLFSAPAISHLAVAMTTDAARLFGKLIEDPKQNDRASAALLPALETVYLYVDAATDGLDDAPSAESLAPVFSSLVAAVNSRQDRTKAVREVRMDRKVWAMYSWEALHGANVVVV
ncbi:unnamed protein product [Peniophora sp. CBMAI 1063]|nr:unnamed protein product [Peniophora sp. CBMAI 1063]